MPHDWIKMLGAFDRRSSLAVYRRLLRRMSQTFAERDKQECESTVDAMYEFLDTPAGLELWHRLRHDAGPGDPRSCDPGGCGLMS